MDKISSKPVSRRTFITTASATAAFAAAASAAGIALAD